MGRNGPAKKTDYGTVILHLVLAASLTVAVATGLRIATETPGRSWLDALDAWLPKAAVWTEHLESAVLLIATGVAYIVYVRNARLGSRIRFDRVRLRGLLGRRHARWSSINIALYWLFFLALLSELATGILMYIGGATYTMVQAHWLGMWFILGYVAFHVFSQWRYGGAPQLLRVFRPGRLAPQPPPFEIAEVLSLLDEHVGQPLVPAQHAVAQAPGYRRARRESVMAGGRELLEERSLPANDDAAAPSGRFTRENPPPAGANKRTTFALNAFVVACMAAGLTAILLVTSQRQIVDTLYIYRIDPADAPVIDGETSDPIWQRIQPLYVRTEGGGNFGGTGETTVSIRAVHDGQRAYFLFIWDDPSRSLKQLPLTKAGGRWQLLHDGYENGDEHAYNEDKFAVLLTQLDTILAGDTTFHAGVRPISNEPASGSGRGFHYTMGRGLLADVWQWKALSTNTSNHCDDDYFGQPVAATQQQLAGLTPYRGGFAHDPGTAGYQKDFTTTRPGDYADGVLPRRLPNDFASMTAALGRVDLDPNHGESERARWYLTDDDSVPYTSERDRIIPDGAVIPGVIITGTFSGDRAAVSCAGRWAAGRWALEVTRRLQDQSPYHVPIKTATFMRVAAFDHTQIQHTRHVRPIRIEVQ